MKKMFLLLALFSLLSCSDDKDTTSPTKGALQPTTLNSYWIFDTYDIDSNNVEKKTNTYDSVVVSGQKTVLEKLATIFTSYTKNISNGQITSNEEYYIYEENQKVYMHSSRFNQAFGDFSVLPVSFKEQWVKVADLNDDDWKAYEDEIPETAFMGLGTFSGKLLITGESKGKKEFPLNNKKYTAYEFYLNVTFNGNLKLQQLPIPINLNIEQKIYLQFVNGIGLVMQKNSPTKFPIFNINVPGSKSILTKFLIK